MEKPKPVEGAEANPTRSFPPEGSASSAGDVEKQETSDHILTRRDKKNRGSLPAIHHGGFSLLEILSFITHCTIFRVSLDSPGLFLLVCFSFLVTTFLVEISKQF